MSNISSLTPLNTRRKLIIALIMPILSYGDVLFSSSNANTLKKLEICYNACLRYIYKRGKFDHLSDVRESIFGCDLATYFKYRLAVQIFVIMKQKEPAYLYNSIEFSQSERTLNIKYPRARTNIMLNSFSVRSAQLWNSLPNWVKLAASITEFKRLIKSHLGFTETMPVP